MRIVIGVVVALVVTPLAATPSSQSGRPFDHWRGSAHGVVSNLETDRGTTVIHLEDEKVYRVDGSIFADLLIGDGVWLHRDWVQRERDGARLLVWKRPAPDQLPASGGIEAARQRCREQFPDDFVTQNFCIEQQEEAFRNRR